MRGDLERVLVDEARIARRVAEMAQDISRDLLDALGVSERDGDPELDGGLTEGRIVFIPVMTGAMVFTADLVRRMPLKLSLELVAVSSYPGATTESKGARLAAELPQDLTDKHVVLIDDILDTGRTLGLLSELVGERGPASLRIAVLLDKPARRAVDVRADYVGFEIPDEFVVGYGLDYGGYYRNLPEIATLRADVIRGEDGPDGTTPTGRQDAEPKA